MFTGVKESLEEILTSASKLIVTMKQDRERHREAREAQSVDDKFALHTMSRYTGPENPSPIEDEQYQTMALTLSNNDSYEPLDISRFLPGDRREKYKFCKAVQQTGFSTGSSVWYSWSPGGQLDTLHFVWLTEVDEADHDQRQAECIKKLEATLPKYHSDLIRRAFISKAAVLNIKPYKARALYSIATNDATASLPHLKNIDERVLSYCSMEDEDIILDLRQLNHRPAIFDEFFNRAAVICDGIIQGVEVAVDDRRHGHISHLAAAMSTADLYR